MKGQSQMVSAILIVLITLGIIGGIYPWASSVIQKKKDSKTVDDVYNFFQKLDSTIINIARNGGEESVELKTPGIIEVYPNSISNNPLNNSIVFKFQSKVTNVAGTSEWIPLNTPNSNPTGILGIDKPGVILANSTIGERDIDVWYRVWYRELRDPETGKTYKINITTSDQQIKASSYGFIRIQKIGSTLYGDNLITTEVNIIV
ncbi:MAG: hypothetical protein QXY45_02605 [Candidatus Aenigmatarchaeota archaeon]